MQSNKKIAVDAMGGDGGPSVIIPSVEKFLLKHNDVEAKIFGDSKIIEKFSQSDNKYISYLTNVIDKMYSVTSEVSSYWTDNKDSFISSTENTSTSSIKKVTNDFIFYYEKGFRANKIGIIYQNGH